MRERLRQIVRRLERVYGPRPWRRHGRSALDALIGTILSQHTSDANSNAAFAGLRRAFPSWDACLDAHPRALEMAIRCGGLARQKTRNIRSILATLRAERGRLSLEFLGRRPTAQALDYLRGLPGVGPKTAACVLLFYWGRPVFPVDTHIHRIARRMGLIPETATAAEAHEILGDHCPPGLVYPLHVLLIEHGRRVCRARGPSCGSCALRDLCLWPQKSGDRLAVAARTRAGGPLPGPRGFA